MLTKKIKTQIETNSNRIDPDSRESRFEMTAEHYYKKCYV